MQWQRWFYICIDVRWCLFSLLKIVWFLHLLCLSLVKIFTIQQNCLIFLCYTFISVKKVLIIFVLLKLVGQIDSSVTLFLMVQIFNQSHMTDDFRGFIRVPWLNLCSAVRSNLATSCVVGKHLMCFWLRHICVHSLALTSIDVVGTRLDQHVRLSCFHCRVNALVTQLLAWNQLLPCLAQICRRCWSLIFEAFGAIDHQIGCRIVLRATDRYARAITLQSQILLS